MCKPGSTFSQTANDLPPFRANKITYGVTEHNGIEVCPVCGTLASSGFFRLDVPVNHPNFGQLAKCTHPFHSTVRNERLQNISCLGPEDIKRKLSDIAINDGNRAMIEATKRAIERGYGWLYIFGGPGNAKSEALIAIVNEMNISGRGPAVYTNLRTLINYMLQTYQKDRDGNPIVSEDYLTRFERLKNTPILAIDEVEKPKETDWMLDFRFHFLDARYRGACNKIQLTIFAGNPHPNTIFDNVLFDRFQDGRFELIENTAPSSRRGMKW